MFLELKNTIFVYNILFISVAIRIDGFFFIETVHLEGKNT